MDESGEPSKGFRDFSPLPWTDFFDRTETVSIDGDKFNVYVKGSTGPVFLLLHGGGYSGLTWACFVAELTSKLTCRVISPDLRGHGATVTSDDVNLSVDRQLQDIQGIYGHFYGAEGVKPPLIVVGHSMGGALAIHLVHAELLPNVQAIAVIDVVEGTAMAALSVMTQLLRNRPHSFASAEKAVKWCFDSGMTKNLKSARISMPSQVVQREENGKQAFLWRINLTKTQPHWVGWFKGLSKSFLDCKPVKILILANVDRLDKELLMRGMFQYEVLRKVGHAVHEDSPDKVADIFVNLVNRYRVIFNRC